jgi:hypothetical protein
MSKERFVEEYAKVRDGAAADLSAEHQALEVSQGLALTFQNMPRSGMTSKTIAVDRYKYWRDRWR